MNDQGNLSFLATSALNLSHATTRVLAVGDIDFWKDSIGSRPRHRDLEFVSFRDLIENGLIPELTPDLVVSPVVTNEFDCLELAFQLSLQGFKGAYRAISTALPRPEMILKEVNSFCPTLNFDIIWINKLTD